MGPPGLPGPPGYPGQKGEKGDKGESVNIHSIIFLNSWAYENFLLRIYYWSYLPIALMLDF